MFNKNQSYLSLPVMDYINKYRFSIIILIISVLLTLGFYDYYSNGYDYRQNLKLKREWNLGGLYVKHFDSTNFYAESNSDKIIGINYLDNLPSGEVLRKGDLLQIKSIHLGGDTVDVKFIHLSRNRMFKILFSIIPVLLILSLFLKYFKFDVKKNVFIRKINA